ncbi:hypothetical protein MY1884_006980 [Beauveria asiatica]
MVLPATQKAIVVQGPGVAKVVTDRPIPELRHDYILVKTAAVGLNPTDWKSVEFRVKEAGPVVGCDYAGVVHGSNIAQHQDGAFGEYIVAKGDLQIKIPDNVSFEDAATLGISVSTVGQSLYQTLHLGFPSEPAKDATPILIYGGSSATAILGIQYAKLSGYEVITTCSPHNNALVKALGADAVFDYHDPDCAAKIREYTNDKLTIAWDTVSLPDSTKICERALWSSPPPGTALRYHSLLPTTTSRSDGKDTFSLAYTAIGEGFTGGHLSVPASEEDFLFGVEFWDLSRELLGSGKIKASPVQVGQGLQGVLDGLQALKENKVSGKKLVCKL